MNLRQRQLKDLPLENAKVSQASVVCSYETAIRTAQKKKTQAVIDTDPGWDVRWSRLPFFSPSTIP